MDTHNDTKTRKREKIDSSAVTPATGTSPDNKPIAQSLANEMPRSDFPASERSMRADPDKTIPGPEAVSGVDQEEEQETREELSGQSVRQPCQCRNK